MTAGLPDDRAESTRREFLSGRAALKDVEASGRAAADALLEELSRAPAGNVAPSGGPTVRLQTRAMNCEFAAIFNPGPAEQVMAASDALDLVHRLEEQMTAYRPSSELSQLNARAFLEDVPVEPRLYALLCEARRLCRETEGAFDPTSGPLIALWRRCREEGRIPQQAEIDAELERTGMGRIVWNDEASTVRFDRGGVELNLGAIGKGHALDRAGEFLIEQGVDSFLLHGGHSSILARRDHNGTGGWPVGLRNPVFPTDNMATLLLRNTALSTSGAGEQFYRHEGKRYGHILDPRTGWPAEGMLSVTVLAPTAAEADALSTAFFVGGVEIARRYCSNRIEVAALLTPPLQQGRTVEIVAINLPPGVLFPEPKTAVRTEL